MFKEFISTLRFAARRITQFNWNFRCEDHQRFGQTMAVKKWGLNGKTSNFSMGDFFRASIGS
jgi:hypothetical protein